MINPLDMQNDMAISPFVSSLDSNGSEGGLGGPQGLFGSTPSAGDAISRMLPPFGSGSNTAGTTNSGLQGLLGQLGGLLSQLGQMLQQLLSGSTNSSAGATNSNSNPFGNGNQQFFQNATGGSTGDPHLSFDGNTWNNMTSQPNLLNSNSFPGGFSISTQATQPNAQGVTWNQQATVTSHYGRNEVSLNANGSASILQNGQTVPISAGQTVDLGGGESVTQNQNGSLQIVNNNDVGGSISTTLSRNGQGVDVQTNASDVDLAGSLVNGPNAPAGSWPHQPPTRQAL